MRECAQSQGEAISGCLTAPVVTELGKVGDHQHNEVGSEQLRYSERGFAVPGCPTVPGAVENPKKSANKEEFRAMPRQEPILSEEGWIYSDGRKASTANETRKSLPNKTNEAGFTDVTKDKISAPQKSGRNKLGNAVRNEYEHLS